MRLPRQLQYALLFTLYLCRSGRTTTEAAAEGLGISQTFLEQIARKLRKAGIVKSIRGPRGGYEIDIEPTVAAVFRAAGGKGLLTGDEYTKYKQGEAEHRSFAQLTQSMNSSLNDVLNRKVRSLMDETVATEYAPMQRLGIAPTVN